MHASLETCQNEKSENKLKKMMIKEKPQRQRSDNLTQFKIYSRISKKINSVKVMLLRLEDVIHRIWIAFNSWKKIGHSFIILAEHFYL